MKIRFLLAALILVLGSFASQGMVFFNLDNSANQTDPGTGVPWDSVGKITTSDASGVTGSAVYLGAGFILTANHVTIGGINSYVTFNGNSTYQIDLTYFSGNASAQVAGVDMKVIKLTSAPSVAAVNLLTTSSETTANATLIGWGVGRGSTPLGNSTVAWGNNTTSAKRWGLNAPTDIVNVGTLLNPSFAVRTVAGGNGVSYNPDGVGDAEAALSVNDSGGGLFQNISGTWYLIGIAIGVQQQNGGSTSTFGNDRVSPSPKGDDNYYQRISDYDTQIQALIPEPSAFFLAFGGLSLLVLLRRGGFLRSQSDS